MVSFSYKLYSTVSYKRDLISSHCLYNCRNYIHYVNCAVGGNRLCIKLKLFYLSMRFVVYILSLTTLFRISMAFITECLINIILWFHLPIIFILYSMVFYKCDCINLIQLIVGIIIHYVSCGVENNSLSKTLGLFFYESMRFVVYFEN